MSLCFVLMPFGRKPGPGGATIDFDSVWNRLIRPAVLEAGLEPIRADEEQAGGIIHKPMFERLVLCEFAVAERATVNADLRDERGVRHGVKPCRTTPVFAPGGGPLSFGVAPLRGRLSQPNVDGRPARVEARCAALAGQLAGGRDAVRQAARCRAAEKDAPRCLRQSHGRQDHRRKHEAQPRRLELSSRRRPNGRRAPRLQTEPGKGCRCAKQRASRPILPGGKYDDAEDIHEARVSTRSPTQITRGRG